MNKEVLVSIKGLQYTGTEEDDNREFTGNESLEAPVRGRIKIKVTADNHSGGFIVK